MFRHVVVNVFEHDDSRHSRSSGCHVVVSDMAPGMGVSQGLRGEWSLFVVMVVHCCLHEVVALFWCGGDVVVCRGVVVVSDMVWDKRTGCSP